MRDSSQHHTEIREGARQLPESPARSSLRYDPTSMRCPDAGERRDQTPPRQSRDTSEARPDDASSNVGSSCRFSGLSRRECRRSHHVRQLIRNRLISFRTGKLPHEIDSGRSARGQKGTVTDLPGSARNSLTATSHPCVCGRSVEIQTTRRARPERQVGWLNSAAAWRCQYRVCRIGYVVSVRMTRPRLRSPFLHRAGRRPARCGSICGTRGETRWCRGSRAGQQSGRRSSASCLGS